LFREGRVTAVLNLKVAMFQLALFPQFVDPARGSVLAQSVVLTQTVIAAPGDSVGIRRRFVAAPAWNAWFKHVLAGVFATLAVRLALDDRQ
jgi:threonine/homoserine/homoserine lactone efflux protein